MLINCPECKKEISDTAPSCPNCGYILKSSVPDTSSQETVPSPRKKPAIFQFISLGALFVALFTPRILISLPCLVIISTGIIALVRKEPRWLLSLASIILAFFFISASTPNFGGDTSYIGKMEIQKWDWTEEHNYSYIRGRIRNGGDKTVSYFKIKALYKDAGGTVLDTGYTNSGEDLLPGMSKEFEIMHKESPEYKKVGILIEEVQTK